MLLLLVLVSLCSCVTSLNNGEALLPPMGWNTWCTDDIIECTDDFCNEKEVKQMADAMVSSGMQALGYKYINLDDCWANYERDANGSLYAEPSRFPSGLPALIDYIHSKGLLFGLYTCAGNLTCKYGRPGSWGHFEQDANTFASWGVDYVKMDWCYHPSLSPQTVYSMMRDALNKTGRHMLFNLCEWGEADPWLWGSSVGNTWRVGPDHMPFWWLPETNQGTAAIIENMVNKSSYAGPGGWNDPDFLMTGAITMTHLESQSEFSFWALFAAPLIVATDIRYMSNKADILLNQEVIAVNQDPLAKAGDRIAQFEDGGEVWTKPLADGSFAVILYNPNFLESITVTIDFTSLWPSEGTITATVRDLWAHEDLGAFTNSFSADVEGHGVSMVKIAKQ